MTIKRDCYISSMRIGVALEFLAIERVRES